MPVEFTLEFVVQSGNNNQYRSFISDLRQKLKDGSTHNIPALIPFEEGIPTRFFDLVIEANKQTVRFRLRRDNLYLIGYQMANGKWLEFNNEDKKHIITGAEFLGFDGSYSQLTKAAKMDSIEDITVGSPQLTTAIQSLATSTDGKIRAQKLLIVIVMFCEATRFNELQDFAAKKYVNGAQLEEVKDFMSRDYNTGAKVKDGKLLTFEALVHLWGRLSERLFYDDAFPDGKNPPLKEWSTPDVVAVLGIALRYSFKLSTEITRMLPDMTMILDHHGVEYCFYGRSLVEVFSVRINNNNTVEEIRQIYGTITVSDGVRTEYIYNRSSDNPEYICSNQDVSLTGPSQAISALGDFTIKFLLHDKAKHDEVILDQDIHWNAFDFGDEFDKLTSQKLDIDGGSVTVNYTPFRTAVIAMVDIGLLAREETGFAVYGSVWTSWDDAETRSLLFRRPLDESVHVSSGTSLPLSRSVIAVPMGSTFKVMAELYKKPNITILTDAQPVMFETKMFGEDSWVSPDADCRVSITVSWTLDV